MRNRWQTVVVVVVVVILINMGNSQEFDRSNNSGTCSVNHVRTCETGPARFHLFLQPRGRMDTAHPRTRRAARLTGRLCAAGSLAAVHVCASALLGQTHGTLMTVTWLRLPRSSPDLMGSKPLERADAKALSQQVGRELMHWLAVRKKSSL